MLNVQSPFVPLSALSGASLPVISPLSRFTNGGTYVAQIPSLPREFSSNVPPASSITLDKTLSDALSSQGVQPGNSQINAMLYGMLGGKIVSKQVLNELITALRKERGPDSQMGRFYDPLLDIYGLIPPLSVDPFGMLPMGPVGSLYQPNPYQTHPYSFPSSQPSYGLGYPTSVQPYSSTGMTPMTHVVAPQPVPFHPQPPTYGSTMYTPAPMVHQNPFSMPPVPNMLPYNNPQMSPTQLPFTSGFNGFYQPPSYQSQNYYGLNYPFGTGPQYPPQMVSPYGPPPPPPIYPMMSYGQPMMGFPSGGAPSAPKKKSRKRRSRKSKKTSGSRKSRKSTTANGPRSAAAPAVTI